MKLIPINEYIHENKEFTDNPECLDSIYITVDYFKKIGYTPPWIGYYVQLNDNLVGSAAFKGKPVDGKIEIAYGVFPQYQHKGLGTRIAAELVKLSLKTDPTVKITARTFTEENYSTRILLKNNFKFLGAVIDEGDGEVWEWEYQPI
ncbi:MAG: hypothetical protein JWQ63_3859 [Mucilaginibacter sp.]|jgi:ribosomal-protein-alanine N-acetyltransferase|nr:hypothetical protein [Mucilaginibacter sp.]